MTSRRHVLVFGVCAVAVGRSSSIWSAAPAAPGAPGMGPGSDAGGVAISRERYDRWVDLISEAAEAMAEETDEPISEETQTVFERQAIETLEEKGYRVPSPPMNLRVN